MAKRHESAASPEPTFDEIAKTFLEGIAAGEPENVIIDRFTEIETLGLTHHGTNVNEYLQGVSKVAEAGGILSGAGTELEAFFNNKVQGYKNTLKLLEGNKKKPRKKKAKIENVPTNDKKG